MQFVEPTFVICVTFHRFQGPSQHPVVFDPAAGAYFSLENTPLELRNMLFVDFECVYVVLESPGKQI